jgi:hypothetical protein
MWTIMWVDMGNIAYLVVRTRGWIYGTWRKDSMARWKTFEECRSAKGVSELLLGWPERRYRGTGIVKVRVYCCDRYA